MAPLIGACLGAGAKTPLRFFVLTSQDFRSLLDRNPRVERKVLHALARRVLELSNDPALA